MGDFANCCPSTDIKRYLRHWNSLSDYVAQENALHSIFSKKGNTAFTENALMIKCSALNDFYSTNIFKVYYVVQHYLQIQHLQSRLASGQHALVCDLRYVTVPAASLSNNTVFKKFSDESKSCDMDVQMTNSVANNACKTLDFYSFATKFCSHHNPDKFPIYDNNVDKALRAFRNRDKFYSFNNGDLKCYLKFVKIIEVFRERYKLTQYSYKEIDRYLWLLGKIIL